MGTCIIILKDRNTFADLDTCLILLATEAQERRYKTELSKGDIRPLVDDADVERIEFSSDFIRRVLRSSLPGPDAGS